METTLVYRGCIGIIEKGHGNYYTRVIVAVLRVHHTSIPHKRIKAVTTSKAKEVVVRRTDT